MQEKWHQYDLLIELAKKYSHSTYLACSANDPEYQVIVVAFSLSLFPSQDERESILLKAEAIRDLKHHHLLPILDLGMEEEELFVVREYLPGESLRHRLKNLLSQGLKLQDVLVILSQVGQVLQYAHEHHIVHGNIKPENILFDAYGQARLADFSLIGTSDIVKRDHIEEYAFCYLAPEQFTGSGDAKSDQYALGCLAYELITGHLPYTAQSFTCMMEHHINMQLEPLSSHVAGLSPSLNEAVLKAMAKDPSDRYDDISAFLDAIVADMLPQEPIFPFDMHIAHLIKNKMFSGRKMQRSNRHFPAKSDPILIPEKHPVEQSQGNVLIKDEIEDALISDSMGGHKDYSMAATTSEVLLYSAWLVVEETAKVDEPPITDPARSRRRLPLLLECGLVLSALLLLIALVFWSMGLSFPGSSSQTTLETGMGTKRDTLLAKTNLPTQISVHIIPPLVPSKPTPKMTLTPTLTLSIQSSQAGISASQSINPKTSVQPSPTANPVVQTITFDDLPQTDHPLNGQYPTGVVNWGQGTWEVMPPSAYNYPSNVIQFANQGITEASFSFLQPEKLLQFVAYNGGGNTTVTVTLSCANLPNVSAPVPVGKVVTIQTGWNTACTTPTLYSPNGWNMLFDNFEIASL